MTAVADKIGPILGESCIPSRQKITTQLRENSKQIKLTDRKWFHQYNEENPASPLHFIIDIGSNAYMKCIIISIQVQYIDRTKIGFPRKIKTVALEVIEALTEEEFIKHLIRKWNGEGNLTEKINVFMNKVNKQWIKERKQNIRKKERDRKKNKDRLLAAAAQLQQNDDNNHNIDASKQQQSQEVQYDEIVNTQNVSTDITNEQISSSSTTTNTQNDTVNITNESSSTTTNIAKQTNIQKPLKHTSVQPRINTANDELSQSQDMDNDTKMDELGDQDETSQHQDDIELELTQNIEDIDLIKEMSKTNLIDSQQDKIENVPFLSAVKLNQPLRFAQEYIEQLQQEVKSEEDNDCSSDDVIWPGETLSDDEFTALEGESIYIEQYDSFIPDNWTMTKFYDSRLDRPTQWFVSKKNKAKIRDLTSKTAQFTGLTKHVWRYINAEQIKLLANYREELKNSGKSVSAQKLAKKFPMDDFFATNCTSDAGMQYLHSNFVSKYCI